MRPHLTTQAIMEAENAIIERTRKKRAKWLPISPSQVS
jgi:hypothetical protein